MCAPCKDCSERACGCHAKCEKYAAFRVEADKARERREYEKNADVAKSIAINHVKKRRMNYKI